MFICYDDNIILEGVSLGGRIVIDNTARGNTLIVNVLDAFVKNNTSYHQTPAAVAVVRVYGRRVSQNPAEAEPFTYKTPLGALVCGEPESSQSRIAEADTARDEGALFAQSASGLTCYLRGTEENDMKAPGTAYFLGVEGFDQISIEIYSTNIPSDYTPCVNINATLCIE